MSTTPRADTAPSPDTSCSGPSFKWDASAASMEQAQQLQQLQPLLLQQPLQLQQKHHNLPNVKIVINTLWTSKPCELTNEKSEFDGIFASLCY